MDMGIVNAGQLAVYDNIDAELREACEDVVLNRRDDATERLLEVAERFRGTGEKQAKVQDLPGGSFPSKSGCNMRWSTALPTISRLTRKRRASRPPARCMSSKGR